MVAGGQLESDVLQRVCVLCAAGWAGSRSAGPQRNSRQLLQQPGEHGQTFIARFPALGIGPLPRLTLRHKQLGGSSVVVSMWRVHCWGFLQGRTGPYFQDFNDHLIEDLLARYPNLVRGPGLAVLLLSHVVESRAAAHPHTLARTAPHHHPAENSARPDPQPLRAELRRQHHAPAGLLLL